MRAFRTHITVFLFAITVILAPGYVYADNAPSSLFEEERGIILEELGGDGVLTAADYPDEKPSEQKKKQAGLPQLDMSTYPTQVFWLVIFFTFLYIFFSKRTLPDLSSIIENRNEHIQSDLSTAEKVRTEAEDIHETYEQSLAAAHARSSDVFENMQTALKEKAAQQQHEFREKADAELKESESRIAKEKKAALKEMEAIAAELSAMATEKIIGVKADPADAKNTVQTLQNNGSAKAA